MYMFLKFSENFPKILKNRKIPQKRKFPKISEAWDKAVIQRFRVGYRGTCHLSLVFSSYIHTRPKAPRNSTVSHSKALHINYYIPNCISFTCSQCLLLIPGLRRPWIRGI